MEANQHTCKAEFEVSRTSIGALVASGIQAINGGHITPQVCRLFIPFVLVLRSSFNKRGLSVLVDPNRLPFGLELWVFAVSTVTWPVSDLTSFSAVFHEATLIHKYKPTTGLQRDNSTINLGAAERAWVGTRLPRMRDA